MARRTGREALRIAQISPLAEAVPPKLYGGTERVIWWLTEALTDLGHEVTLFASGDSVSSARLIPGAPTGLRLAGVRDHAAYTLAMLDQVLKAADAFDILHFHTDLFQFPIFRHLAHKCVTTLHGRHDLPDFWPIFSAFPEMPLVSISEAQRAPMPNANFVATIHHGMPAGLIPYSPEGGGYLAFIGRISPEKRPDRAIEIAKRAGIPLKLAAKVDHVDRDYFEEQIQPLLDHPLIDFIGEISDAEKPAFLGGALALLFPIDWPEPFGLVMIEAMAAGTPVIAWPGGSVPEVIRNGKSGLIVDSLDDAVAAVEKVQAMPRAEVRRCFETQFTADRMARDYVSLYQRLIAPSRPAFPFDMALSA